MKIPKGRIFIISTGEYSDYDVQTIFQAKEDLDAAELSQEYLKLFPTEAVLYSLCFTKFIHWLMNIKAVVEEIDYSEWHLGDYSTLTPEVDERRGYYRKEVDELKASKQKDEK
jgi:hypothetical protein